MEIFPSPVQWLRISGKRSVQMGPLNVRIGGDYYRRRQVFDGDVDNGFLTVWIWDLAKAAVQQNPCLGFPKCAKGAWSLLRSGRNDTMRWKVHPQGGPHIVAAIPPQTLLISKYCQGSLQSAAPSSWPLHRPHFEIWQRMALLNPVLLELAVNLFVYAVYELGK